MTLKTALVIAGDASGAVKAADQAAAAMGKVSTATESAERQARLAANGVTRFAGTLEGAAGAAIGASAAGERLAQVEGEVARATATATRRTAEQTKASNDNAAAANRHAFATRNLGQQFGDLGLSIAGGISPARAFGQQAGQMGYALSEMGGKAGAVGAFLVGPWGIALTVGIAVLAPFIEQLFKTGDAADQAKDALADFAKYESTIGNFVDNLTGRLRLQNRELVINAQLTAKKAAAGALKTVQENSSAGFALVRALATSGPTSFREGATGRSGNRDIDRALAGSNGSVVALSQNVRALADAGKAPRQLADTLTDLAAKAAFAAREVHANTADVREYGVLLQGGTVHTQEAVRATIQLATAHDKASRAAAGLSSEQAKLNALFDQPYSAGRETQITAQTQRVIAAQRAVDASHERSSRSRHRGAGAAIGEFGQGASARLAAIGEAFDETPPAVKRVNTAVREIDQIMRGLREKKPTGFATMLSEAERLKGVVQSGLTQPLRDFVKSQQESFAIGEALLAGEQTRADTLRTINGLERNMRALTDAEKGTVEGTVLALAAQARQLDILHAKQQVYLDGLGQIKGIVQDATQAFVRGDLGQFIKTPGKLLDAFQSLQGEALFNKLFDGAFRDLQDAVTGTSIAGDAAGRMAQAVDAVTVQTNRTTAALGQLGAAASAAAGVVAPGAAGAAIGTPGAAPETMGREVVVRANQSPTGLFVDAIGKVAGKIGDILGVHDPKAFGKAIGTAAGKGLEGAATGSFVNGIAGAVGIKLNKTGSQIGGAIGGVTGIPGGAIIGSILGGAIGSLFGKSKTNGSAGISIANGQFAADKGTGANGTLARQASGLAAGVANALSQIAQQLGGGVGSAGGVTIGVNNGNTHVNAVGGTIGKKGSGDVNFGDDADAAVSYAIGALIGKGAVTGLSAAVAKALQSSTDINAALSEALKVRDLELTIGGIGAQLNKAFADFENQAKDRVRIAQQYGFDVIAIEKRNADDRGKLADQLAKAQVGSIQQLLEDMQQGSLFEGSAVDKITALTASIAKAQSDLDAGVEGAGDTLSGLLQQRLTAGKDAFGTTSGYADIRQQTVNQAQAAIAAANARIIAAQAKPASDPALVATNEALDENNDQNAEMLARLKSIDARLESLANAPKSSGSTFPPFFSDARATFAANNPFK